MEDLHATVALLVKQLKKDNADSEDAFHNLLEMDHAAVPFLISAFRAEADDEIRATLTEIIWQHRQPASEKFLLEILEDPNSGVWENALDGLVTLGSPNIVAQLKALRKQFENQWPDRICWIDEALEQINESLSN